MQCVACGKTDTVPGRTFRKVVIGLGECGGVLCNLKKVTPAFCWHCSILT